MRRTIRRHGDPTTARVELYAAMKEIMVADLRTYYKEFSDRTDDDRSRIAIERSYAGLTKFYDLLDTYEIAWKAEPVAGKNEKPR